MPTETPGQLDGPPPRTGRLRAQSLLCLLLLVGAGRMMVLVRTETIARDGAVFLHMARELTGGNEVARPLIVFRQHPGYPAVVGAVARTLGARWPDGWAVTGQVISAAMSLAAVAAVCVIGTDFFGPAVGLIGALVFGLSPRFVQMSCDVTAEATALALGLWAIVAALRARNALPAGRWRAAGLGAAAGLLAGLAYLTRPEYLLTVALAVLAMLAVRGLSGRSRAVRLAAIGAALAASAACVTPYAIAIGGLTLKKSLSDVASAGCPGQGAVSLSGSSPWRMEAGQGDSALSGAPLFACGSAGMPHGLLGGATPKDAPFPLQRVGERLSQAIGPAGAVAIGLAILTWVGLYVLKMNLPQEVRVVPAAHGAVLMFAPLVAIVPLMTALEAHWGPRYVATHHMLLCAGMLAPAAGAGVIVVAGWGCRLFRRLGAAKRAKTAAAAVALGLAVLPALPRALLPLHKGKAPYRYAGRMLAMTDGGGHFVAGPNSWVPFYALAPAEQFTEGTDMSPTLTADDVAAPDALRARLRRPDPNRQYRYIAVDDDLRTAAAKDDTFGTLQDAGVLMPLSTVGRDADRVDLYLVRMPPRKT